MTTILGLNTVLAQLKKAKVPPSIMDVRIDKIYYSLPARSIAEIAENTGLSVSEVNSAICYLREHKDKYRWTIPHAKRGISSDEYRFHCALLDKNDKFECDPGAESSAMEGQLSTLRCWASQGGNQAVALRSMATSHIKNPLAKRLARTLASEAEHMAGQALELIELITEMAS